MDNVLITIADNSTSVAVQVAQVGIKGDAGDNAPTIHSGLTLDDGTNPHGTTKADVGLGSVPNISFSGTNTGDNATNTQYSGLEASKENTSNKSNDVLDIASTSKFPVWKVITDWVIGSFATIANLNLKAPLASPTFTGVVEVGDASSTGNYIKVTGSSDDNTYLVFRGERKYPKFELVDTLGASFSFWNLGGSMRFGSNPGSFASSAWFTRSGNAGNVIFNGNVGFGIDLPTQKVDVVGNIKLSGIHILGQYTTATEPAYVKGAQFFNTTLNKMRIGGASAYETVTSS